jgi:lysophospholipase L1-like esterase
MDLSARHYVAVLLLVSTSATTQLGAQSPVQPSARPDSVRVGARQAAEYERLRTDWAGLQTFVKANAELPAPALDEDRVVFMGNSIIELWTPYFDTMFPGKPYIGRGISGQTTPQMLVRFRQDVVDLHPKAVMILAGTNDIAGNTGPATLEMIENNLASMAELAKANGIRVVMASVLPAYNYSWRPSVQPASIIVALNQWIKDYASRTGAVYVDFHSAMVDERLGLRKDLSADGVHPDEAGFRVMAPLAEAAIREALQK